MTPSDNEAEVTPDPITEFRHELEHSALGNLRAAEELSRITDVFIVRHPGLAEVFHRELDRVCEKSGLRGPPSLSAATGSFGDDLKTVVTGKSTDKATPKQAAALAGIPEMIGRWRVLKELGRGGMGMVLLAHDPALRRRVAIKVLPQEFARDPQLLERFRREATAVTELEHPGIVPIYEIGEQDGLHYYVMRHVDGLSLRDWCREQLDADRVAEASDLRHGARALLRTTARRQGRASFSVSGLGSVLRVFEEVARALHHAHEQGIIHRDIKPANVMVDRQGFGQLLDFGLAQIDREATMTRTGLILGTVAYMAPEQISPDFGSVGARTDVFALGVSLFECLTGTRPFLGETPEATLHMILTSATPSPLVFVPELSRDIETVILKCLEKRMDRRYASAAALADDLARIRAHERIEAQPIGPLGRALRWAERHRSAASLMLLAFMAVLILAGVILGREIMDDLQRRAEAQAAMTRFDDAVEEIRQALPEREQLLERLAEAVASRDASASKPAGLRQAIALLDESMLAAIRDARTELERARSIAPAVTTGLVEDRLEDLKALGKLPARWSNRRLEAAYAGFNALVHGDLAGPGRGWLKLAADRSDARLEIRVDRPGLGSHHEAGEIVAKDLRLPIERLALEAGSYMAKLTAPGCIDLHYPFLIEAGRTWGGDRFEDRDWTLHLRELGSFEVRDFVQVPGGPYLATIDRDYYGDEPELAWRWLDDFVIARHELEAAAWEPFIEDPQIRKEIEQRPDPSRLIYLPRQRPNMPSGHYLDPNAPPADIQKGLLHLKAGVGPLALGGISWSDAQRYLRWREESGLERWDLPTAAQWEKAARGVDGRLFPWGSGFDWTMVQGPDPETMLGRFAEAARAPTADRSPYGILHMAGHMREWCRDGGDLRDGEINPYLAGGDCSGATTGAEYFMCWPRNFLPRDNVQITYGLRPVLKEVER